MKIKTLFAMIVTVSSITVYADNQNQSFQDGTNLMNTSNVASLDTKFVSSKKMYELSDAKSVIRSFGLTLLINGKSNIDLTQNGTTIVSSGTVKDYLNTLGTKFGYSWNLNGSNVVFTPIIPAQIITPKPLPTPVVVTQPKVEQTNTVKPIVAIVPVTATPVVATIKESDVIKTPTQPLIVKKTETVEKTQTKWEVKVSDKTIKKSLQRWANDAGWQLIWNTSYDYPISATMIIDGTFDEAVNEICVASQYTDNKITGDFHTKNKVLVITSQD